MTSSEAIQRLREYADLLERANVHDDMALSLTHTQAADAMRDASCRLSSAHELPESLAASIALFKEDPDAWHAEWQRVHDFKVKLITENERLRLSFDRESTTLLSIALRKLRLSDEPLAPATRILADVLQETFDRDLVKFLRPPTAIPNRD